MALEKEMRKPYSRKYRRMAAFAASLALLCGVTAGMPLEKGKAADTASLVAFPGAEGGGSLATGGRGGEVVYVTNLNDSGEGSFREAVSQSNRIVVFAVGGTIELKSDVVVQSNITVAGQTAPGGAGITLKNYKIGLGGSNTILRFVSSRPGERGTSADYDAFGGANGANCIVDHCSIGWANDEQWGLYSNNDYNTVQYSVIGPSNSFSYHSKGIHGFGIMFGRSNCTWHHNLIVHNVSRNFRGKVVGTETAEFVNNVIYNWATQTAYGTLGHVNYVNNTLKKGISTVGGHNYVSVGDSGTLPENYLLYLVGNRFLNRDDTQYSDFTDNNWSGISYGNDKNEANTRSDSAFQIISNGIDISMVGNAESAEDAYDHVLTYAGAGISSTSRTAIDQQVAYETLTGTGTLTGARPSSEATEAQLATITKYSMETGVTYTYPSAVLTQDIVDTDRDGMSDDWEVARGLDPNSIYAADGSLEYNGDYCGQGYTNIEYYINDLTVNAFPEGVVTLSPTEGYGTPVEPMEGVLIHELMVNDNANRTDWSIQYNMQVGDLVFGDRDSTFTSIPSGLLGAEWIRTACDSKTYTADVATFTAAKALSVFVALDTRVTALPAWLSDWSGTGAQITGSNDVIYEIYQKDYAEGALVTLGSNGTSSGVVNYFAAVALQNTVSFSNPGGLPGDVNEDGLVNADDAKLLDAYLLGKSVTLNAAAADLNADETLNGFDFAQLKRMLLS